eukprot:72189_1
MATKVKKKKKKIGFALKEDPPTDNKNLEAAPFKHKHQQTAHALEHAKMVQKGKKYWEEKEQFEHVSNVQWWQLKAAKDFETGIGQTFYHQGTLSTWNDEQIAALQKEMQQTLQLAGYGDKAPGKVTLDDPEHAMVPSKKVDAGTMDDFAAEIKRQQQKSKPPDKPPPTENTAETEEEPDPLYDFDDEIIHTGDSDDEDDDGKRTMYTGSSMGTMVTLGDLIQHSSFDAKTNQFQQLTSVDQLAGKFDADAMGGHRRTRTEALRVKLQGMQTQLEQVTQMSFKQSEQLQEQKLKDNVRGQEVKARLNGLTGALQSANDELDAAEEQIINRDQEISNLKRELALSKQMNDELAQCNIEVGAGITADDILKQRIKDANRFAFMLSAMQEQLDFERKQFVHKIHNMELQLEHKDIQLNALYQLYNQLVAQTQNN